MSLLATASEMSSQGSISIGELILLVLAVGLALAFEFVNGFHDTANAVATVIYTHSLKPWIAVIWSGCWNLIGVLTSSGGIAFTVVALLPTEMVLNVGSNAGFAMVFALLLSAIIWNVGTWYMGLPASSSHSLFGAIIGVGLANMLMTGGHHFGDGVNVGKLRDTLLALLISPIFGFVCAGLLLLLSKAVLKWPALYQEPKPNQPPPWSVRSLLILTCTGVSFGHGSNDGQKGMGLMLLILIGILPATYALNPHTKPEQITQLRSTAISVEAELIKIAPINVSATANDSSDVLSSYMKSSGEYNAKKILPALVIANQQIIDGFAGRTSIEELPDNLRSSLRKNIYEVRAALVKMKAAMKDGTIASDQKLADLVGDDKKGFAADLTVTTQYIPFWVKLATALALGFGTMIGWKRIVVTVGEKIGKTHLTYAQGASAELVAAATIIMADQYHLPVSTTHVLSSGVAGAMAANKSGLQMATLRNLLLAWVLTLPVCTLLGAALFAAGLEVVLHHLIYAAIGVLTTGAIGAGVIFTRRYRAKAGKTTVEATTAPVHT